MPDLPAHLAYIADAVEQGKNIRSQAAKLRAILEAAWEVAQQDCQRCGGEGRVVKPDAPGIRTRWYEDCPECKLKEAVEGQYAQKAR